MALPELQRGFSYRCTFTISEGNARMDLTGATAKFVIGKEEFTATIPAPLTGVVEVSLTPEQTANLRLGRKKAYCKVTIAGEVYPYGVHYLEVV